MRETSKKEANEGDNDQRMKRDREAKKGSRVISGRVESVLFSPSRGGSAGGGA
jgi:hypothetical protein